MATWTRKCTGMTQEEVDALQMKIALKQEQHLIPLKEDLADWLNKTLGKLLSFLNVHISCCRLFQFLFHFVHLSYAYTLMCINSTLLYVSHCCHICSNTSSTFLWKILNSTRYEVVLGTISGVDRGSKLRSSLPWSFLLNKFKLSSISKVLCSSSAMLF